MSNRLRDERLSVGMKTSMIQLRGVFEKRNLCTECALVYIFPILEPFPNYEGYEDFSALPCLLCDCNILKQ